MAENHITLDVSTILIVSLLFIFLLKNIYLIFNHRVQSKFLEKIKLDLSKRLFNKYLEEDYSFYLTRNTSIFSFQEDDTNLVMKKRKKNQIFIEKYQ